MKKTYLDGEYFGHLLDDDELGSLTKEDLLEALFWTEHSVVRLLNGTHHAIEADATCWRFEDDKGRAHVPRPRQDRLIGIISGEMNETRMEQLFSIMEKAIGKEGFARWLARQDWGSK
jgi:hypothetical protein